MEKKLKGTVHFLSVDVYKLSTGAF